MRDIADFIDLFDIVNLWENAKEDVLEYGRENKETFTRLDYDELEELLTNRIRNSEYIGEFMECVVVGLVIALLKRLRPSEYERICEEMQKVFEHLEEENKE